MKPRLILLSAFLTPFRSGAEACVEEVALRLCDQYDITIITARLRRDLPKKDLLCGKVPVIRVGLGWGMDKWLFPFLAPVAARACVGTVNCGAQGAPTTSVKNAKEWMMGDYGNGSGRPYRSQPIILHAVLETFAGLALLLSDFTLPDARKILTLQTLNRSFLKRFIIQAADRVTAISEALVAIAQKHGRDDVIHIPNGVDLAAIHASCEKFHKVPGRMLFVGRLERMKGVDTLLTAFAKFQISNAKSQTNSKFQIQNFHLRIVGDGSERGRLERMVQELGISDRVTFTGFIPVPQIYDEFAQAEIFCGLSRSEALGNVFIEAQAAGCAVLGTRVGGIPDIVTDGVTGLLISLDNVEEAEKALSKLFNDRMLRERLAEAGRKNAQKYDWDVIAERYARVYEMPL